MSLLLADLHTHTTCSDGSLTPAHLVARAAEAGLAALAVTDHDTILGLEEAEAASRDAGIEFITGVELSVTVGTQEVHLLAYAFDPENAALRRYLHGFHGHRMRRAEEMVRKLNVLGLPVTMDGVMARAGDGAVGRPHVALALVDAGIVETPSEAFDRFIGDGQPAHVAKPIFPAEQAIALVKQAGGLAVIAHPGNWTGDDVLMHLIRSGMEGIEVVHPSHEEHLIAYYQRLADEFFLLSTGGSDFHGWRDYDAEHFGRFGVPLSFIERLRRRAVV